MKLRSAFTWRIEAILRRAFDRTVVPTLAMGSACALASILVGSSVSAQGAEPAKLHQKDSRIKQTHTSSKDNKARSSSDKKASTTSGKKTAPAEEKASAPSYTPPSTGFPGIPSRALTRPAATPAAPSDLPLTPAASPSRVPGIPTSAPVTTASGPATVLPSGDRSTTIQWQDRTVDAILDYYESLTGKLVVKDTALSNVPKMSLNFVNISKADAIYYIEATLNLNGVYLIPGPNNTVKVINATGAGKNPRNEGLEFYTNPADIPSGDRIISYFMRFQHIPTADAVKILKDHTAVRANVTTFTEVANAQAVVITESIPVILKLIALQSQIDVPPAELTYTFVTLKRANAEDVADTVREILEGRDSSGKGASKRSQPQQRATGQNTAAAAPSLPMPQAESANRNTSAESSGMNESSLVAGRVRLVPDVRTNRILVVARPSSVDQVLALIEAFDKPADIFDPFKWQLRYVPAGELLDMLEKVLAESEQEAPSRTRQTQANARNPSQPGAGSYRSTNTQSSLGSGSNSSGTGSSGASISGELELPDPDTAPEVLSVGKIRVIADKRDNSLIVIGPPESIERVRSVVDLLDVRPRQVYLRVVIGQLTVTNENEFGIDLLQKFQTIGTDSGVASANRTLLGNAVPDPTSLIASNAFPLPSGLMVYGALGKTLNFYVKALETTNRFKVLSRPFIYTANNKRAIISSGQEVPVPETSLANTNNTVTDTASIQSTIAYKKVLLELAVVPLINSKREVTLSIAQKNDNLLGTTVIAGNEVPNIATQTLTTYVTVPNQTTVVLGGLAIHEDQKDVVGIPYISRIPYIGNAFKDTTRRKSRRELIVLIQPVVIESEVDMQRANAEDRELIKVSEDTIEMTRQPIPKALPVVTPQERRRENNFERKDYTH
ncbi:MAG: secretin N-terminal domain-containing protein [Candidatus Methylacidiphilales bacterium]|nr:secretin N-terminal domain-containing protein [Candidatus Methylacidiphilales bacterium]